MRSCVVFSLGGLVAPLLLVGPNASARYLLLGGSAFMLVVSLIGVYVLRGERRYGPRLAVPFAYACNFALLPALLFFGWFSPIVILVALGGVIFAMGHSTRSVLAMGGTAVAGHVGVGLLSIFNWIEPGAIGSLSVGGLVPQLFCLVLCEALIMVAFLYGRRFRAHALTGIESHARVVHDNARREALLEEAVEEINRVRRVGDPGRFTGLTLGSFDVGVVLGRGGMGEVYEATHVASGEPAAIKVLAAAGEPDEQVVARFRREIAVAAQIESPHVVRVLEFPSEDSHALYLAMERLRGRSLSEELRDVRRPPIQAVLTMLQHVALGISAAHAKGIVHRDLTPQNIFHHCAVGQDVWKILDFGIARAAGAGSALTGNAIVGTPRYMSPEQVLGGELDGRSDLFALGSVAYRCLTGRPAFKGGTAAFYQIVNDMPIQPSRLAPLSPQIDDALAVALAKSPEDRYPTAEDLVKALAEACDGNIMPTLQERARRVLDSQPWS